jgi:hypothetical protein
MKEINRDYPLLIFSNIVNNLMIGKVDETYGANLNVVTPREIWLAKEGDILVSTYPMPEDFKAYACNVLGIEKEAVITLDYPGDETEVLALRILKSPEALANLKKLLAERPTTKMLAFAHDEATLQLARELNIELMDYTEFPDKELIDAFYNINTKNGFRKVAASLDLNITPGVYASNRKELFEKAFDFLQEHKKIVFKFNRSSNGYGISILEHQNFKDVASLNKHLENHIAGFDGQPQEFVLEKFIDYQDIPSVELIVDDDGYELLYLCNQFCIGYSWAGMITPPIGLDDAINKELHEIGDRFGNYIYKLGFRGVCDVDCGVSTSNEVFASESNFRRTGGTYTDILVRRLRDRDYYNNRSCYWIANVKTSENKGHISLTEAIERLKESNLLFNHVTKKGVILTYYTFSKDQKWRYLIIDDSVEEVSEKEIALQKILNVRSSTLIN